MTPDDFYLFREGTHERLFECFGSHPEIREGRAGTRFTVWAPHAREVSMMGDFNGWRPGVDALQPLGESGVWEGFRADVGEGAVYKYAIQPGHFTATLEKSDPFAVYAEAAPNNASIVSRLDYAWSDAEWMGRRREVNSLAAPMSIYEMHLGSWMREGSRFLGYRELAPKLSSYLLEMGFTHVEFLPVMEHPFYGSWGYQITNYFAATSRYGPPTDLMYLIDHLHRKGLGVILDWVPSHFPSDAHGLGNFDGTHLYEHPDPRKGFHPDWNSYIFNYGRPEVRSFLLSNALFWIERFHADALRVDAVASMLYLDYSRREGEWIPNEHGGRENLESVTFLCELNRRIYARHPDVQVIAEESTAWPGVSRPVEIGGLGFGLKWDMGWMHDTLSYVAKDPVYRKYSHHQLTFRAIYQHSENFVLALSHDEVVHGKHSLLGKIPGDDWQRVATLRLLYAYMYASPGKKLLFMGSEFGVTREWNHEASLDWSLLKSGPLHRGLRDLVVELNRLYRSDDTLSHGDFDPRGFEWVDHADAEQSVLSFLRVDPRAPRDPLLAVFNFTPVPRDNYRLGVPAGGEWCSLLNTDEFRYGGSGYASASVWSARSGESHGRPHHLSLTLPPLGALYLKRKAIA